MPSEPYQVVWPVGAKRRAERPTAGPRDAGRCCRPRAAAPPSADAGPDHRTAAGGQGVAPRTTSGSAGPGAGRHRYQPTAYVTNQILVSVAQSVDFVDPLIEAFNRRVAPTGWSRTSPTCAGSAAGLRTGRADFPAVVRVSLVAESEEAAEPPDAWRMVQRLRDALADEEFPPDPPPDPDDRGERIAANRRLRRQIGLGQFGEIGLNHLMFAAGDRRRGLQRRALGRWRRLQHRARFQHRPSTGPTEYAIPGLGGRAPVRWLGRPPVRTEELPDRPVVAILDTGVADHPGSPMRPRRTRS